MCVRVCVLHSTQIVLSDKAKRVGSFNRIYTLYNGWKFIAKAQWRASIILLQAYLFLYIWFSSFASVFFGATRRTSVRERVRLWAYVCVLKRLKNKREK